MNNCLIQTILVLSVKGAPPKELDEFQIILKSHLGMSSQEMVPNVDEFLDEKGTQYI